MSVAGVVNRGKKFDDSSCANKWKWEWMSVEMEVKAFEEVKKERIGTRFWKVGVAGAAWCIVCNKDVTCASGGVVTLTDHLHTKRSILTSVHLRVCWLLCAFACAQFQTF